MPNSREFLRKHTRLLDEQGVNYTVEHGGKHTKLRISFLGYQELIVLPTTPSDHRSEKNSMALLRRKLRLAALSRSAYGQAA